LLSGRSAEGQNLLVVTPLRVVTTSLGEGIKMVNSNENKTLIKFARDACMPMRLHDGTKSGEMASAILSESGRIYTGICIDLACGLGFCAEAAAINEMLRNGESKIVKIVSASSDGSLHAPCSRCREMIAQINGNNSDTIIVLDDDHEVRLHDSRSSRKHGTFSLVR
jgi:cytidine deaminase